MVGVDPLWPVEARKLRVEGGEEHEVREMHSSCGFRVGSQGFFRLRVLVQACWLLVEVLSVRRAFDSDVCRNHYLERPTRPDGIDNGSRVPLVAQSPFTQPQL